MDECLPDGQGYCPFDPRGPIDGNLFVGREEQIKAVRLLTKQAARRHTRVAYISGQPGIGKTSLAWRCKRLLEFEGEIHGFRVFLGRSTGPGNLRAFLELATRRILQEKIGQRVLGDKIKRVFDKYVEEVSVGGIRFRNPDHAPDMPRDTEQFLAFLRRFKAEIIQKRAQGKPIVVIFDELDGVVVRPYFADFLRGMIENNTGTGAAMPLVIVLCGSMHMFSKIRDRSSRVATMVKLIEIEPLENADVRAFFKRAFGKIGLDVTPEAMQQLVSFSHGLPQLMHLIGENTFYQAEKGKSIERPIACRGILSAADELGKYQHPKVRAMFSNNSLRNVLQALGKKPVEWAFTRRELIDRVGKENEALADRFVKHLKQLGVIVKDDQPGKWRFLDRLVGLYIQKEARLHPSCDCEC